MKTPAGMRRMLEAIAMLPCPTPIRRKPAADSSAKRALQSAVRPTLTFLKMSPEATCSE